MERSRDGRFVGQATDGVTFQSSDPKVVAVEEGIARPVGNGQATITAKVGDQTATAKVTVADFDGPLVWSFRNHVESVLSKAGCNSGACHGARPARTDSNCRCGATIPPATSWCITRQPRGRRIVPSDPGRSLMLTKPTGAVPHKGGLRFRADSLEYRVLSEWIAAGRRRPRPPIRGSNSWRSCPRAWCSSRAASSSFWCGLISPTATART